MPGDFTQAGVELTVVNFDKANKQLTTFNKSLAQSGKSSKQFADGTNQAGKQAGGFGKNLLSVQSALAGLGLGFTVNELIRFGTEAFNAAAQAERLGTATDNLAKGIGASGQEMVDAITEASLGTVSKIGAMEAANKALLFDLVENSDQMAEMTQIAITLGAAMGQDATKSLDDLTTALGRQSPMILDNLGITLKLEEAYRIYAAQLGKNVEALTEQEKKQAFVNAALIKGREKVEELGGVTLDTAGKTEQMSAAWSDFTVAFGGLLTELSGGIVAVTEFVRKLEEGAEAWKWVFDARREIRAYHEEMKTAEIVTEAGIKATQQANDAFLIMSGTTAEAAEALQEQAKAEQEATRFGNMYAESGRIIAEVNRQEKTAVDETTEAVRSSADIHVLSGEVAAAAYREIGEAAMAAAEEAAKARDQLVAQTGDFILSFRESREEAVQSEQEFNARIAQIRSGAAEETKAADSKLSEELIALEQEREEKLHWVLTGAHARTQEENAADLAHWNAHFDTLVADTTTKFGEQTAAIDAERTKQQASAQAARDQELAEQQEHLNQLKLNAALATLETTGQLAQFTGGLAVSAQQAADLIEAGILPVTDELAAAIQNTLGQLQAQEAATASQATSNQAILQDALSGTLVPLDEQAIAMGTTLPASATATQNAMMTMNQEAQLGLQNTQLATENEDLALQNVSNITLPGVDQAMAIMNQNAQTGLQQTDSDTQTLDDTLNEMGTVTLPAVTESFDTATEAGKTMADEVGDAMDDLEDKLDDFEGIISKITKELEKLADAAERAFQAAADATDTVTAKAGLGFEKGIGFQKGFGFQKGTLGLGVTVPGGFPDDTFGPLFLTSREQFMVTPPGVTIDDVVMDRLMSDGLVNATMTVNHFNLNVSTVASPGAVIQQYEVAKAMIQ